MSLSLSLCWVFHSSSSFVVSGWVLTQFHRGKCVAMLLFHPVTCTHTQTLWEKNEMPGDSQFSVGSQLGERRAKTAKAAGLAFSLKQSPEHSVTGVAANNCITCDTFRLNISSDVAHFACQFNISLLCRRLEWIAFSIVAWWTASHGKFWSQMVPSIVSVHQIVLRDHPRKITSELTIIRFYLLIVDHYNKGFNQSYLMKHNLWLN